MLSKSGSAIALMSLLLCVSGAQAATKVVSKWGADSPTCGPGATPCATIGHAISIAAAFDRVLVHPGTYVENLVISTEGLELTSLSGRSVTKIVAADAMSDVITVNVSNVRIGEKANGFSIGGGSNGVFIDGSTSNVKIEGNRLSGNTADGLTIYGDVTQIRFNIIENNTVGVYCGDCYDALIQKNTISSNTGDGLLIGTPSNDTSINQNIIVSNGNQGINYEGSGGIVNSNVVDSNGNFGMILSSYIVPFGEFSVRGNVAVGNQNDGLLLTWDVSTPSAVVKHNLSVNNTGSGISSFGIGSIDFENNTVIGSSIGVSAFSPFLSFKDNTTYGNTGSPGVGIEYVGAGSLTVQNHFLGSDITLGPVTGSLATRPNLTKVGIAKGLGF